MSHESRNSFRPAVESTEGRVLAAVGLTASPLQPAEVQASAVSTPLTGQAWVDIVNRTDQILYFQLSTDAGATYRPYHVRLHSTFYYQVNRNDPSFDLLLSNGSITNLATGPTRKLADTYYVNQDLSVTGGSRRGRVGGTTGLAAPLNNVAQFSILNETARPSGKGGVAVKIVFSVDGGQSYPISDTIPYTGGKVPTPVTFRYGSQGIIYRIPANPSLQPTPLNPFGEYDLFRNSRMRP
jgi:hypothetical protein